MTEGQLRSAFRWLSVFLEEYEDDIVAVALGRYAAGKFAYPSGPLYKKSRAELAVDIIEELADAGVYAARRLET